MADMWGWEGVMSIRIIQGMFQGFFFPSVHNIIGKWAPKEERSTIGNFVFTGKLQYGKDNVILIYKMCYRDILF